MKIVHSKKGKDNIHENSEDVYSHWVSITNTSLLQKSTRYYTIEQYKSCLDQ